MCLGSTLLFPERYAIDEGSIGLSFMDGTLFVAHAQERFSQKVRYIFPGPERAEYSSHIALVAEASSQ